MTAIRKSRPKTCRSGPPDIAATERVSEAGLALGHCAVFARLLNTSGTRHSEIQKWAEQMRAELLQSQSP